MVVRLTPRLQAVAEFVPRESIVADIGTDHAYIPIYLVMNNKARRILAIDIKAGPLAVARNTVELFNMTHSIALRLGDGLEVLDSADEVDTVIIAGMGGERICSILERGKTILPSHCRLILQPMTHSGLVRTWLAQNDFYIKEEELVREGRKIYEVIVAQPGEQAKTAWLEFGPILTAKRHRLLAPLLKGRLNRLLKASSGIKGSITDRGLGRSREIAAEIFRLEEVIAWLKQPK